MCRWRYKVTASKRTECRHAMYAINRFNYDDDLVTVSLVDHLPNGEKVKRLVCLENLQVPYWVVKPYHRKYEQTKECESKDRLDEYKSNKRTQPKAACSKVGLHNFKNDVRLMRENQYIYGTDITPTAIIKNHFFERDPDLFDQYDVAVLDIETDVVYGTNETILISVTMKGKSLTVATRLYTDGIKFVLDNYREQYKHRISSSAKNITVPKIDKYEKKFLDYYKKKTPEHILKRHNDVDKDVKVMVVDTPIEAIKLAVAQLHEWKPDFVTGWNLDFDITRILEDIQIWGGDAGDIWSDPAVPKPYRNCKYVKGRELKVTESGKKEPLKWYDQYHVLDVPAYFYVIDQAAVFRKERIADGIEPSMALDAILKKYTNFEKLKDDKYANVTALEKHRLQQMNDRVFYGVYNVHDCIGCEVLDEQEGVRDLSLTVPLAMRNVDFSIYNSQPKRLVTDMHFFYLKQGYVLGTKGSNFVLDLDAKTLSTENFIVTLPSHMVPYRKSGNVSGSGNYDLVYKSTYDLDVTGAYPDGEDRMNCSRETSIAEIIQIGKLNHDETVELALNLTAIEANAMDIGQSVLGLPSLQEFLDDFVKNELPNMT